jgi:AAA ATPase domain
MAGTGVMRAPTGLVGRENECAVIDRMLGQALDGEGAALVIRGEAGIGKSALLEYAGDAAGKTTVLRATGVEAESDLAFAGMAWCARPWTSSSSCPARKAQRWLGR